MAYLLPGIFTAQTEKLLIILAERRRRWEDTFTAVPYSNDVVKNTLSGMYSCVVEQKLLCFPYKRRE